MDFMCKLCVLAVEHTSFESEPTYLQTETLAVTLLSISQYAIFILSILDWNWLVTEARAEELYH